MVFDTYLIEVCSLCSLQNLVVHEEYSLIASIVRMVPFLLKTIRSFEQVHKPPQAIQAPAIVKLTDILFTSSKVPSSGFELP